MLGIKKMSKYHLDNHLRTLHHNTHLHLQQPGSCAHPTKEKNIYKTQNPNENQMEGFEKPWKMICAFCWVGPFHLKMGM